jgi:integrase
MNAAEVIKITEEAKISKFTKISNDGKIIQWLEDFSEGTQIQYIRRMWLFCECSGKTPSELITEANAETRAGLLLNERKNLEYMSRFKAELKRRNYSPKANASAVAAVKSFYNSNDIQLSRRIGKIKKATSLRENRNFLKKEDIKKLIDNANSLRDKAIILIMATSGMARKEIINLKVGDISIDEDGIGTVTMRRQKNDVDFITFISPEAVQALKLYWEERARYKKGAFKVKGVDDYVFVTNYEGKKIETTSFSYIFRGLAKQLGFQNNNGKGFQIKCKSHALRKFFSSTLEDAGMSRKKIDFMMAHALTDNEIAYYENEVKKLKDLYINFLPHITFEKEIKIYSLSTEDEKRLHELEQKDVARDLKEKEMEAKIKELTSDVETFNNTEFRRMFGKDISKLSEEEREKVYAEIDKEHQEWQLKHPQPPPTPPAPYRAPPKLTAEDYKLLTAIKPNEPISEEGHKKLLTAIEEKKAEKLRKQELEKLKSRKKEIIP